MTECAGYLECITVGKNHEGCFQGALLLQSTTMEGEFKADQVERGSVGGV